MLANKNRGAGELLVVVNDLNCDRVKRDNSRGVRCPWFSWTIRCNERFSFTRLCVFPLTVGHYGLTGTFIDFAGHSDVFVFHFVDS